MIASTGVESSLGRQRAEGDQGIRTSGQKAKDKRQTYYNRMTKPYRFSFRSARILAKGGTTAKRYALSTAQMQPTIYE